MLTLIDLIISITIVGIAVTGTLLSINRSVRSSADPLIAQQALIVAGAYLEEILLNDYYDPDLGALGGVCLRYLEFTLRRVTRSTWYQSRPPRLGSE